MKVTINNLEHPCFLGGYALKKIFQHFGTEDFNKILAIAESAENDYVKLNSTIENISVIAFYAIENGYLKQSEKSPFPDVESLLVHVENIHEIMPVYTEYIKSMGKFFKTSDSSEGEVKGEMVASPSLPLPN